MSPEASKVIRKEFVSTYDRLLAEGYQVGRHYSKFKYKLEVFVELLIRFPNLSNELLLAISRLPKTSISPLKKAFKGTNELVIIRTARKLFLPTPYFGREDWEEVDKLILRLWKRFKAAQKSL